MTNIVALWPCPFCGCAKVFTREGNTYRWMEFCCEQCGVSVEAAKVERAAPHDDPRNVIAGASEWNRRPAAAAWDRALNVVENATLADAPQDFRDGWRDALDTLRDLAARLDAERGDESEAAKT